MKKIARVLIANRGEPVARIARTLRSMGLTSVGLRAKDEHASHARFCDEMLDLSIEGLAAYLDGPAIVDAAVRAKIDAIHPAWGFLSERADFARLVEARGLVFIGPTADQMERLGDKAHAKDLAQQLRLPLVPSATEESLMRGLTYPILLKPVAGGGGKGMIIVNHVDDLSGALTKARREAQAAFGDDRIMAERYVEHLRHVEVQVLGDGKGHVWTLGERDCTIQRRYQKIIEESPSPFLTEKARSELLAHAKRLAEHVQYRNAGTVEFMMDSSGQTYFMEMNTRLQVEHGVTEERFGVDLVELQIRLAMEESIEVPSSPKSKHVLQMRVYAEDPYEDFMPSTGEILAWEAPSNARVDHALREKDRVDHLFDPMLAKILVNAPDRPEALEAARRALSKTVLMGVHTNLYYLDWILSHGDFRDAKHDTLWTNAHRAEFRSVEEAIDLSILTAAMEISSASAGQPEEGEETLQGAWNQLTDWRMGGSS